MKNKFITIGILVMFLLTSFSVVVIAEHVSKDDEITLDYFFKTPVIQDVDINAALAQN